jgi:hypothetical protein
MAITITDIIRNVTIVGENSEEAVLFLLLHDLDICPLETNNIRHISHLNQATHGGNEDEDRDMYSNISDASHIFPVVVPETQYGRSIKDFLEPPLR